VSRDSRLQLRALTGQPPKTGTQYTA